MEHAYSAAFIIFMTVSAGYNVYRCLINLQYIKFYMSIGKKDSSSFKLKQRALFFNCVFAIFFLASLLAELLTRYA